MKNKISFFLKNAPLGNVKDWRKIFVCCIVFVSVFSLRFVVEKQQVNISLSIATSEANQLKTVSDIVSPQDRIDVNTAQLDELQALTGIGPKLADAIIKNRKKDGPFREASDLLRIKGIGPKKLEKMIPHLHFDPPATK